MADRADLVVVGGGLAGLSLAMRLAQSGYRGQVRVLEPREQYIDDRSWAFWTPRGKALPVAPAHEWNQWLFSRPDGASVACRAKGWRYAYVRSIDFYRAAVRALAATPNIRLILGARASAVESVGEEVMVTTSAGRLHAPFVVDTRPPSASQWSGATLFQCFAGRELRLDQPGFDARRVELMTDMRCDARGFVFSYVLPLSANHALVEATRFSSHPLGAAELAPDLDALLAARGWSEAKVLRTEAATLPMGLPGPSSATAMRGVVSAGMGAGALRAASGYGFVRIQAWAEQCAAALMQGRPPVGHPAEPRLRGWMDRVFLRALANHPERTPEFFMALAASVPSAAFVRFMSDQAGWADHARIIASLPPGPFLQALPGRPRRSRVPA